MAYLQDGELKHHHSLFILLQIHRYLLIWETPLCPERELVCVCDPSFIGEKMVVRLVPSGVPKRSRRKNAGKFGKLNFESGTKDSLSMKTFATTSAFHVRSFGSEAAETELAIFAPRAAPLGQPHIPARSIQPVGTERAARQCAIWFFVASLVISLPRLRLLSNLSS